MVVHAFNGSPWKKEVYGGRFPQVSDYPASQDETQHNQGYKEETVSQQQ